jgi:hypothetical protein
MIGLIDHDRGAHQWQDLNPDPQTRNRFSAPWPSCRSSIRVVPDFSSIQEASTARTQAEQRLKRLLDHQHDYGFNLRSDDPRVLEQERLLKKLTVEFDRIKQLNETRSQVWREAGYTLQAVERWLRDGRPPGTSLVDHEIEPPKLAKGENGLLDAIENRRRRVRELRADLHRIQSAPFPSIHQAASATMTTTDATKVRRLTVRHAPHRAPPDRSFILAHNRSYPDGVHEEGIPVCALLKMPDRYRFHSTPEPASIKRQRRRPPR